MNVYCTVLNLAFVPRALALQQSIAQHAPTALFAFFCIDDETKTFLDQLTLAHAVVIGPQDFETENLAAIRGRFKLNEYCWACKPAALKHMMRVRPALDWAIWLDADMLAFGDLDAPLGEAADAAVLLTPHRFSIAELRGLEATVGQFNAGYVAFRNSAAGREALDWWEARCLEGCPATPTADAYADQKYLDSLPQLFNGVVESRHPGLNCAPWNVFAQTIGVGEGGITIGGDPLLVYHFQGFKILRHWLFDLYASRLRLPVSVRRAIYRPYVAALANALAQAGKMSGNRRFGVDRDFLQAWFWPRLFARLRWARNLAVNIQPRMMRPTADVSASNNRSRA